MSECYTCGADSEDGYAIEVKNGICSNCKGSFYKPKEEIMSTVRVSVENGKYEIVFDEKTGELRLMRGGEIWDAEPKYSKMFIALIYEIEDLKAILNDIQYDFDPEVVLGPPCGPEMLKRIQEHESKYGKLR